MLALTLIALVSSASAGIPAERARIGPDQDSTTDPWAPESEPAPEPAPEAVPVPVPVPEPAPDTTPPVEPEPPKKRTRYEVGLRFHYVQVPDGMMDVWYLNAKDPGWPIDGRRPTIEGLASGIEFTMQKDRTVGLFYLEYGLNMTGPGYWDVKNKTLQSPVDGKWVVPSDPYGAVVLGVNGAYDAEIVSLSQTQGKLGFSFFVGGGLGIAILVGELDHWTADIEQVPVVAAYETKNTAPSDGPLDIGSIVWPVPDLLLGFKFNFADFAYLRLEGGLHGGISGGGSVGARF